MDFWLNKGFQLKGTGSRTPDIFIASKPGQYAVVRRNFFDEYIKETEWFRTEEQAREEASYFTTV